MSQKFTGSKLLVSYKGAALAILITVLLVANVFAQSGPATPAQVKAQVAQMPLAFEPNQGQSDPQVKFLSRGTGYLLLLTRDEAVLSLGGAKAGDRDIVRLKLAGANRNAKSAGAETLGSTTNYFLGNDPRNWQANVPNFGKVRYTAVYPGIDLLYYGKQNTLEHDFIVSPNVDPGKIALEVKGAKQLRVDAKGNLVLMTAHGQIQLDKPFIFQTDKSGRRVEVAGGFVLKGDRVGFQVGAYDKSRELVIDPVLNYASYLGGDSTTTVNALTVDASGNAYITGSTASSAATLVGTACATCGAPDRDGTTKLDVFVAKLNSSGTAVAFTTIVGGAGDEQGNAIAVDSSANIYVTGQTASAAFPTTAGAYRTAAGNNAPDAFAFKLASSGATLSYSTYLNGGALATDHADIGRGIAVDAGGLIYVTGSTASTTFLPATFLIGTQMANADATGATTDAFLVKLNPAGSGNADLLYGTYWGGTADDGANAIGLLSANHAVIAGFAQTAFPTSGGAADTTFGGTKDGFVTNLPATGAFIASATCVDTAADERRIDIVTTTPHGLVSGDNITISDVGNSAGGLTVDGTVAGTGTSGTVISYVDNICNTRNGQTGVVTAGLSRVVGRRKFSTYVGGDVVDEIKAIALDGSGNIYATGSTNSLNGFPNGGNTIQATKLNTTDSGTATDAFVAKLAASGASFTYSAYLGGTGNDVGNAIVVNPTCTTGCEAYVVGTTASGSRFNSNSLQGALSGTTDGFVARVNSAGNALIYSTYFGGAGADSIAGAGAVYVGTAGTTNTIYLGANSSTGVGAASTFGAGASVTSSAAQTAPDAAATGSVVVAKLSANNVANPSLGINGVKSADPIGQSTAFTSTLNYTWTITNTNAAKAVTVDIPMPQAAGADLLSVTGTPSITGTGSAGTCTKKIGTATQPGGLTCELGDLGASGSSQIIMAAAPTAAAHCDNSPCAVPTISQTAKVASAEIGSLVTSSALVSNVVPVTDLVITGTVATSNGADDIYVQGTDTSVVYSLTVTNNSGLTIAGNSAGLDVLVHAAYPANLAISTVLLNGGATILGDALVQGTPNCFDDTVGHVLECNVTSIAAGGNATVVITGALNAAPNAVLTNLVTTSKFPPSDTSEIFTANGTNTNVNFPVTYSGPEADLQITAFTESADPVRTAQNLTYTVSFDNAGPTDATSVKIAITPSAPSPANTGLFTFVSNTPGDGVAITCTQPGGAGTVINCPVDNADVTAAATAKTFTVTGTLTLDAAVASTVQATSAVISTTGTTSEPGAGVANNTANLSTTIRREAALSVSNFSAPATVANTQSFSYTFDIANSGLDNATSSIVTLSLPQNANAVTFSGNGSGTTACAGTTTVTCNIGTVTAGAAGVTITVTVTPSTLGAGVASAAFNGSITNIASANVVSTGGTKTAANLLTTVQRQTTISVANLADTADPVASNGTITYNVDVFNTGANAATNVKLDYTVTTGSTTSTPGCSLQSATVIRCNVASVPTGGFANKVTFALTVTPSASLIATNQASATASASVTFNAAASTEIVDSGTGALTDPAVGTVDTTVERRGDVQLFNLTATPTVSSDGNITVQAQVQNLSGVTATNVQVVFTFDNNYRFQSANVVNANGISNSPAFACTTSTATTRTCTLPNLPISTLYTFNIIVKPEAGIVATNNPAGNSTNVNVSATISASVVQSPNTGNDTSGPLVTEVQRQANLRASGASTAFTGPVTAINSSATATYNLTVRNDGPDTTDGAVVVFSFTNNVVAALDSSPAAQTAWGGLGTCVRNSASTVTCTMASGFATGARTGSITITPDTATLLASTNSAPYDVTAAISSANAYDNGVTGAAGSDNSTGIVTTTVQRQADLRLVSKTAPASVADGGAISYTIVVQNFGPDAAGSVRLVDPLPVVTNGGFTLNASGATFVSPTIPAGACAPAVLSAPPVTVVCMLGPLNSGQQATITITGVANIDANVSSATFNNVATVDAAQNAGDPVGGGTQTAFETNGGNNSNTVVSTTVSRSANLYMVDPVNSTPVLIGGTPDPSGPGTHFVVGTHESIRYDISVGNNAASSTTVTTASVQTTLPSTLTFNGPASPGCSAIGQVVTCAVSATLTPGGSTATVSFVAVPGATLPTAGNNLPITITPSVTAAGNTDPDGSDNVVNNTTTIDRVSNLAIVQTQPVLPVSVTNSLATPTYTYTWQVTNNGPSNATGVVITDALPADLRFESGSWLAVTGTSAGNCGPAGPSAFGATFTCNLSTINSGATVTITVTVRPTLNTALASKLITNTPSVNGLVQDVDTSNNSDSDQIELRGVTDLQTTITPIQDPAASAGQVLVGNNQAYTVTVTNNGPYPAGSVITLTPTIDPNVALITTPTSAAFGCAGTTCTLSSLAVGASQSITVTTSTPAAAVTGQTTVINTSAIVTQYGNGTNVAGDVTDPNAANNTGNASVTGRAAADLGVSQTAPASVVVGQSGNKFALTIVNTNGRSGATNVVVTNTIAVDAPTSVSTTAFGTPSQGTCSAATGLGTATVTITCNLGAIATGAQATIDLAMTPTLGGSLKNTPTVTATEVDPVAGNNTAAQASITVNTTPPGQQTFSPTNPGTGQPVTNVVISGFIQIPGNTTIQVPIPTSSSLALPANYRFGNANTAANYYTISNTATFDNNGITVCVTTPETFFQPHRVRLFRLNPATDITTATGFVQTGAASTHKVCGIVQSLPSGGSTFVAMEPINTVPPLGNASVTITSTGGKGSAGTSVTLDGSTVIDPDSFPCMELQTLVNTGVASPTNCVDQNLLIYRWVGNFTDVSTIDPNTGLKLIQKNCRQTTPFFDGLPCNQVATSIALGSSTITLTVLDENFLINPPAASRTFNFGSTGGGTGGVTTQTVSAGQSGTFSFPITFAANTTFTVTGVPSLSAAGISCSAQPTTYTGPVGGTQTSTVTVLCSTSPPVFAMNNAPGGNSNGGTMIAGVVGLTGLPLVGMVLMPGRSRRQRKLKVIAIFALITLMVIFSAACGGGATGGGFGGAPKQVSAGTAKGTYALTVTATPAPTSGNPVATLTLTVQ